MRKIVLVVMALVTLSFAPGGSIKSDLILINKKMYEAKTYRAATRIVFDYNGVEKSSTASSISLNGLFSYSAMGHTYLSNKKMQVLIDHESKIIAVQDADMPDKEQKPEFSRYEKTLDSILDKNYVFKAVRLKGNYQTVRTDFDPEANYSSLEMTYDSKNHCFKSLVFTCGKKLSQTGLKHIKVMYDEFNFNPGLSEKDFSESRYIVMKGKKIVGPSEKYKGYKVLDQRLEP